MTATPVSDGLNKGMIEEDDHEECDCGGKIGYVVYNADTDSYEYVGDEGNGVSCCKDCHTTPGGNLLDVDVDNSDGTKSHSVDTQPPSKENRDTYSTYSVRFGKKPVKLYGGFKEAYTDPENGSDYCLSKYNDSQYHDGLIIWG